MTSGPSLQFLLDYLSGALNLVDLSGADNRVQDQGQHGDRIRNRLNQVGGERTQGGQSRTNTVAETEQHGGEERTDGVCVGEVHGSQRDEAAASGHVPAEEVHVAMEKYIPPKAVTKPDSSTAMVLMLSTLIPTDSAASGFSPTARIRSPWGF